MALGIGRNKEGSEGDYHGLGGEIHIEERLREGERTYVIGSKGREG